jgi:hypothetical protein
MRDKTWEKFRSGEVKEMRHIAARWFTLLLTMFALSFLANTTLAADDDDPPTRAARLSYASGSVSFEPAGTDEWVDAVVNRPMTTGDKLWADQDGRVEVRIDSYALRLGPQTGFSFLNLDDNVVQVRLTEGSLNVRVRRLDENQTLEIDTPNLAFNILRGGSYRIDVNENGDATLVTVREGQGEVTGGGSAYPVHAGDSVNFSGVDQLSADVEGIGDADDFDQWSNSRDQRWEHSSSARYVSDDAVGYEDLDENGQWESDPDYGTVWYPRTVAVDWAPYRYGHWVWVSPWGWTWVDDASWGFAPFHYGRWVVARGRWCWVPSPPRPTYVTREYVRPVYAPALVAWVGGGVAVGVAWFPLGPRDVYAPSYHVSERYVERVNVSNTRIVNRTQITNVYNNVYVNKTTVNVTNITYQNRGANNAVTATSQASFTTAQPVGRNQVRVDARQVASAPVSPTTVVAPQPRSFTGAAAPAKARPPATLASRNVVAKTAPPPPPAPVAQQVKAVEANGGRPVAVTQIRANQPAAARENVRVAAPAKAAALPPKGNSVNRPGQPGRPAQNQNNARAAQPNQPNPPAAEQPNANRPANVNPNQPNANQPNVNRPNSNAANAENPNRSPNANPNRPANANQPPPYQPNVNRPNPNAERAENPNRPPNANQPTPNQPSANRPNPNNERAENPNRPPNANPNANNPNANRPAENRPAASDRPPAARQNTEPPQNQQRQQQEQQNAEQQRAQQQQLQQQKVDEQRRQELQQQQQKVEQQRAQHQQQQKAEQQHVQQQQQQKAEEQRRQDMQLQQQQREAQKPQPKEPPKEQQKPPAKKDNKDNKDNKDRPPSR